MTATQEGRRRRRALSPPLLLGLFYAALSLAWVLGNPVAAAPDEPGHYLKALTVAGGKVTGERVSVPPPPSGSPAQQAWLRRTTKTVDVPPGLSPAGLTCNAFKPEISAACQYGVRPGSSSTREFTNFGPAQPTTYLFPGLMSRLADNPVTAIQLGRLGGALVSVGLIWMAIALLWQRSLGIRSIVGLLVAVTPMAVFVTSSLTASGPEVAAGICFLAALLRLTRHSAARTWVWAALGASGALLASARTLGPLWVALDMSIVVVSQGLRRSWVVVRSAGSRAFWAFSAVVAGVALSVSWELLVQPRGTLDATTFKNAVRPSLEYLRPVFGELIGVFGWLDSFLPAPVYVLWWTMLAILVSLALLAGTWRARAVLIALTGGIAGLTLFIAVVNLAQTGFGMQGRYVLPIAVSVPLFAGEVLARDEQDRRLRHLERWLASLFLVAGGLQAVAWYANARRSALGTDGSWLFIGSSEWAPRTGWYPLLVLVAAAVLILVSCGFAAARQPAGEAVAT